MWVDHKPVDLEKGDDNTGIFHVDVDNTGILQVIYSRSGLNSSGPFRCCISSDKKLR